MTAAHWAGAARSRSARQFAAIAARSMVKIPPASASAGPLASVMRPSSAACGPRSMPLGEPSGVGQIREARHVSVEVQLHGPGRSVSLLADDEFGLAVNLLHLGQPFEMLFRARARFLVLQVVLLAEDKQHDVCVLLDRSRLAQVGKLRALVVAALDLPRELRQRQDRNVKLLGQGLEAGGDLGPLLHAAFLGAAARSGEKLDVVDDQQIEPPLA